MLIVVRICLRECKIGLLLNFLIATGARISEILNLEIKDLENKNYEFIKVLGKDSKYRIVPIYDSLENEIKTIWMFIDQN